MEDIACDLVARDMVEFTYVLMDASVLLNGRTRLWRGGRHVGCIRLCDAKEHRHNKRIKP